MKIDPIKAPVFSAKRGGVLYFRGGMFWPVCETPFEKSSRPANNIRNDSLRFSEVRGRVLLTPDGKINKGEKL